MLLSLRKLPPLLENAPFAMFSFLSRFRYLRHTNASPLLRCHHSPGVTVADIVSHWTERFTKEDIPEPQVSANLIVAHAFGKKMIHHVNVPNYLDEDVISKINRMCEKRLQRCPVQYIIGEWDFHDMTLEMRPPVLIPRTETEEMAEYILEHQRQHPWQEDQGTILDVGCGSGALGLFLLKQLPQARCVSVDISEVACRLTHSNASSYNLQDRLHVVHGSITNDKVMEQVQNRGPYDVVVSNPPYISTADMEKLDLQVHGYEDHVALHGGCDGMDLIRHILSVSPQLLKPRTGTLWLEVDLSHPTKIEGLVNAKYGQTLKYVRTLRDYTNRERFCVIQGRSVISAG